MSLLEFFEKWGVFIFTAIVYPAGLYIFKSTFATKKELETERLRITVVENKVESLPSVKEMHALSEKMTSVHADMGWVKKNIDLLVQNEMKRVGKE